MSVYTRTTIVKREDIGADNAINSTDTATAVQVAYGLITSTSGSPVTITMPTGTDLGAEIGAKRGTTFDLIIDNAGGNNPVTIAVAVDGIKSAGANDDTSNKSFGNLVVSSGAAGVGRFTIMFSSSTEYVFSRTA